MPSRRPSAATRCLSSVSVPLHILRSMGAWKGSTALLLSTPTCLRPSASADDPAAPSYARSAADGGYLRGPVHASTEPGGLASELALRRRSASGATYSIPSHRSGGRNQEILLTPSCGAGTSFSILRRSVPHMVPPISVNVQGLRTGPNQLGPRSRSLRSNTPHTDPARISGRLGRRPRMRPQPEAHLLSGGSCRPSTCPRTTQPASTYSARRLEAGDRDRHRAPPVHGCFEGEAATRTSGCG